MRQAGCNCSQIGAIDDYPITTIAVRTCHHIALTITTTGEAKCVIATQNRRLDHAAVETGVLLPLQEFSTFPGLPFAGTIGVGDVIANVSAFAGQNVELKLTHDLEILIRTHVDSIFFAAQVPQVPESNSLILSALGGISLFGIQRFNRSATSRRTLGRQR